MNARSTPARSTPALLAARARRHPSWLLPVALLGAACGQTSQTTSSTHWLECTQDTDCANLAVAARCSGGYCALSTGARLEQRLVFAQEFSGTALEPTAFATETGAGLRNAEVQSYTARPENVRVEGDALVLTARAEAFEGAEYTSGSVNTEGRFAFTFGRVEARLAGPTGRGANPAFWMLPEAPTPAVNSCVAPNPCYSGTWPAWGDITVATLRSQSPGTAFGALNYGIWDAAQNGVTHGVYNGEDAAVNAPEEWHAYAVEWGPERIDWYVDDVRVRTIALPPADLYLPGGVDPFRQPFHVRINLAVGGLDQAPVAADYPQELRVDWLRIWQWVPTE